MQILEWVLGHPTETAIYATPVTVFMTLIVAVYNTLANREDRRRRDTGLMVQGYRRRRSLDFAMVGTRVEADRTHTIRVGTVHSHFVDTYHRDGSRESRLVACKRSLELLSRMECIEIGMPPRYSRDQVRMLEKGWLALCYEKWETTRQWWQPRLRRPPF